MTRCLDLHFYNLNKTGSATAQKKEKVNVYIYNMINYDIFNDMI